MSQLYELLAQLKGKTLTPQSFVEIEKAGIKQSMKRVQLWGFKPQIRMLFKLGKFQSYLMFLLGLTVIPFTLYQKYQQDKSKILRIAFYTPFALGAFIGPLLLYRKFTRKLIEELSFNFQTKKIILKSFNTGAQLQILPSKLKYIPTEKGRVKSLILKPEEIDNIKPEFKNKSNTFNLQGIGQWQSLELFKFLVEEKASQVV